MLSIELIEQLANFKLGNNNKVLSFVIENLYTNIPINDIFKIIKSILTEHITDSDDLNNIIKLFELTMTQNVYKFNKIFYKMMDSLSMGAPNALSSG